MNQYPNIKLIFDRRKVSNKTTEGSIEVEIYFQMKRKWVSAGIKVLRNNWNAKTQTIVGRMDANELNLRINHLRGKIESYIQQLMIEDRPFLWGELKIFLTNKREADSFISFVRKRMAARTDLSEGTKRNHQKFLKNLIEFNLIKNFEDLTKNNIQLYDEWLHKSNSRKQSTIASYHRIMKYYVNEALRLDLIAVYPYLGIKIANGKKGERKFLTIAELTKVESATLNTFTLEKVRDLFLFQTYTGLSYADLKKFDFNKVIEKHGKFVLQDVRQKTGEPYYIVLLPKAMAILEKYNYILPLMSLEQYNMRLKIIADAASLNKRLTSHMARHTYATICLNSGISIEILAKMLGHADIKTTQIYATLINRTVEQAYDELKEKWTSNNDPC